MELGVLTLVMLLGLGAYWAMVVYPKQRDFTKRQRYVRSLAVGDEVVTYGGIIGKIVDIEADKGVENGEPAAIQLVHKMLSLRIQDLSSRRPTRAG